MRVRPSSSSQRPPSSSRPSAPAPSSTFSSTSRAHFAPPVDRSRPPQLRPPPLPLPSPSLSPSSKSLLLEDLHLQLNGLLLQSIEKEEVAEDAREELLAAVRDEGEQLRLERIFGVERGKAWQRLQAMRREHQLEVARKMQQLGIIDDDGESVRDSVGRLNDDEWEEKDQMRLARPHRDERAGSRSRRSALR